VIVKTMVRIARLKLSTIYQWTHVEFIPHMKLGWSVRFRERDILTWIASKKVVGRVHRVPTLEFTWPSAKKLFPTLGLPDYIGLNRFNIEQEQRGLCFETITRAIGQYVHFVTASICLKVQLEVVMSVSTTFVVYMVAGTVLAGVSDARLIVSYQYRVEYGRFDSSPPANFISTLCARFVPARVKNTLLELSQVKPNKSWKALLFRDLNHK
jgi:predicted DNA-binding transcriptional regulator AlpA